MEVDKKKSFKSSEENNIQDPVNKTSVFGSNEALNITEISLRKIMAEEEMALKTKKNQSKKLGESSSNHFYSSPNLFAHSNRIPKEKQYANLVKLDILLRKYGKIVDKKAIEQLFKDNE